jgi:sugar phosphate isomerase/epimerase|tara:strand:- start:6525 stop:7454 length:930 start_codon:yes stop_codon:yes gene_type:complete
MKRRKFIISSGIIGALLPISNSLSMNERKFKISLNPGSIGAKYDMNNLLRIAIKYKYEAISPDIYELDNYRDDDSQKFIKKMDIKNITWDAAGLPINFRETEETFFNDLKSLEKYCKTMNKFGITKLSTWIMPTNHNLTYFDNFKLHSKRLKIIAEIITDYNIKLGLEHVGVRTLMNRDKYPFIHTIKELKNLVEEIDNPNIGYQLDSFHWYCSSDKLEDYNFLNNDNIITVDLNDAISGRSRENQIDYERELPFTSKVIDLKKFINFLIKINYTGCVRAEPFNKILNNMDDEKAVQLTYNKLFETINL